jgi:adenine-specific DNA-methyltransferase
MHKIEATDPEAQSANLVADNIAQLKALFPELITEGAGGAAINVDVLKQLVGDATVSDTEEKYGLNWHGKRRARQLALTPSTGTLRPCPEDSVDWDTTQNLMIEGDNLEVLKLLQKSYAGKVKLIYIDPPYNTGKDFVYPDNFQDSIKNYLELTGQVEGGRKISSNTEASGRFHTDWLNMMYPRLKLARNLLAGDGTIFVSISDHEVDNLRKVLNELFGESNYVGQIAVAKGTTTGQDANDIGSSIDFLLAFARSKSDFTPNGLPLDEKDMARFNLEDAKGRYSVLQLRKTGTNDRREDRPNLFYPLIAPNGSKVYPIGPGGYESCWRTGQAQYDAWTADDMIVWKQDADGSYRPYVKYYLEGRTKQVSNYWDDIEGNKKASITVKELIGKNVFTNPKPVGLIKKILHIATEPDSLVLDFFAGSATTAHAVMQLNAEDAGNRRFIMVQLPEPTPDDSEACKAGFATIAEISRKRIQLAGEKIGKGDTGFRVYKLDQSNIRAWQPSGNLEKDLVDNVEHIIPSRSEQDVLTELLLKLGLDLCVPIEQRQINDKSVHAIGGGVLMACLDLRIGKDDAEPLALGIIDWHAALAPAGDTTCVFRDSAFENDEAKTNLAAILEQHGIHHVRSL